MQHTTKKKKNETTFLVNTQKQKTPDLNFSICECSTADA